MKKIKHSFLLIIFVVLTFFAWENFEVQGKFLGVSTEKQRSRTVELPPQASDQDVVALGQSYDKDSGGMVEGYAIIRRKEAQAKGGNSGGKGGKPTDSTTSSCYGFLSSGMKWKTNEPWLVNTANRSDLSSTFVFENLSLNITKWENAANYNILGDGEITTTSLFADLVQPDGENEVYFADIDKPGVIGVTIVWGYFSGPPKFREIVEWDQVYDDVSFDWTEDALIETNKMDFEAIATHELGHTVGLADLYTQDCVEETMYGYGSEGQTHQRDLNLGDITGIKKLYK